jgi:hypothetical protein
MHMTPSQNPPPGTNPTFPAVGETTTRVLVTTQKTTCFLMGSLLEDTYQVITAFGAGRR